MTQVIGVKKSAFDAEKQIRIALENRTTALEGQAFTADPIYATTAAFITASVSGEQGKVENADTSIAYDVYQNNAGSAVLVTSVPAVAALSAKANQADLAALDDSLSRFLAIGRQNQPIDGSGVPLGTYVFATQLTENMRAYEFQAYAIVSVSVTLRRFTRSGDAFTQVGSDVVVPMAAGLNAVALNFTANAGEYIGIYATAGALRFTSTTEDYPGHYNTAANSTSFTDATITANVRIEASIKLRRQTVTADDFDAVSAEVAATGAAAAGAISAIDDIAAAQPTTVEGYDGTTSFATSTFGGWAGVFLLDGVASGVQFRHLGLDGVRVATGATKVRLSIYARADGSAAAPPANCTLVFEADYPIADLGLIAGSASIASILLPFTAPYVKGDTDHLAWRIQAMDGADAKIAMGMGYLSDASATVSQRGWYYSSLATTTYTGISSPSRIAGRALRDRYMIGGDDAFPLLSAASAEVVASAGSIVISGSVDKSTGDAVDFAGTLTPAAAAAGKERMDLIALNRSTLGVSLVAGASRNVQLDALEWQAATPANSILIGRVRVTDAGVQAVSAAGWRGLIRTGAEAQYAAHIERNRAILRRMIGKALRGASIKLGGYGDSITALQGSTPAFTANGTARDRGHVYLNNYPADSLALVPLYDFADGAGAVHTKLGWNWDIKAALDLTAGAEIVTYLNYGIGATTSQSTTNNGLDAARIAEPLGDALDAVVIAFGMNERGQTYTYANIVNMIGQFQAVGTACIVMGCPRPNANQSLSAWRITNAALEAAAIDAGAAYVSTQAIADDTTLGGIGVPAEALASANTAAGGNNHPGIWELRKYGAAAVTQLGL